MHFLLKCLKWWFWFYSVQKTCPDWSPVEFKYFILDHIKFSQFRDISIRFCILKWIIWTGKNLTNWRKRVLVSPFLCQEVSVIGDGKSRHTTMTRSLMEISCQGRCQRDKPEFGVITSQIWTMTHVQGDPSHMTKSNNFPISFADNYHANICLSISSSGSKLSIDTFFMKLG